MLSSIEEVLEHAGVYDPVARRQRYLRDRQLKGRRPGAQLTTNGNQSNGSSIGTVAISRTRANQAVSTERQAAELRARLSKLRAALQKLLAEAKSSSSSSSKSSSSSTKSGGSSTKNQPQTAKEKAAAKKNLEKARKERTKEAAKTPDAKKKTEPTKEEQIAHLRSVIRDVEAKLRAVLDNARTQTASNGR